MSDQTLFLKDVRV